MKLKYIVLILFYFIVLPLFGQRAPKVETKPIVYKQANFDIFRFFKEFDPAANVNDQDGKKAQKARADFQKLEEFGYRQDEITGRPASCFERGPFECVFFEGTLYLIDPHAPRKAIVLDGVGSHLDDGRSKNKFSNEVNQIAVEKMSPDIFRVFAQQLGDAGKALEYPVTDVWDCDLGKSAISHYSFGYAFAKDVGRTGRRDVVVYDEEFIKDHWGISEARIFSWTGNEWIDSSEKNKAFLDEFIRDGQF